MKNRLFKILLSCSVLMTLFAFQNQEKDIMSKLEGTTWKLEKANTKSLYLTFNRVEKLDKNVVGYKFSKNNNLMLTQVWSSCWGGNIASKITSGNWRSIDSKTIQITYTSYKHKSLNKRSNVIIVKKFEVIKISEKELIMKELNS